MGYALSLGIIVILAAVWCIYRAVVPRERLEPGDIVLVVHPGSNTLRNNLITEVLSVHGDSISFRGPAGSLTGSTCCGTHRRYVHKLPIDRHHPILVPGKPVPGGFSLFSEEDTNGAKWIEIPLQWFPYTINRRLWARSA